MRSTPRPPPPDPLLVKPQGHGSEAAGTWIRQAVLDLGRRESNPAKAGRRETAPMASSQASSLCVAHVAFPFDTVPEASAILDSQLHKIICFLLPQRKKKAGLEIGYEVGEVIEAKGDFRKNPVYSAGIVELE